MAGSTSPQDVAARDDAHLQSLGIKPELQRSLGFLSNFAVAFSYISVSTGTFTDQAVAFGVGGPAVFWAWPLVILGQTFVALNFARKAQTIALPDSGAWRVLLDSHQSEEKALEGASLTLPGYGVVIARRESRRD